MSNLVKAEALCDLPVFLLDFARPSNQHAQHSLLCHHNMLDFFVFMLLILFRHLIIALHLWYNDSVRVSAGQVVIKGALPMLLSFFRFNFLTLMLLITLIAAMTANRKVSIPASGLFKTAVILMFCLITADGIDYAVKIAAEAGQFQPYMVRTRIVAGTIAYILRPVIIMLEVLLLSPSSMVSILCLAPALFNLLVFLPTLRGSRYAFWIDEFAAWHSGPLHIVVYLAQLSYVVILLAFSIRYFRRKNLKRSILVIAINMQALTVAFCEYENLITGYVNSVTALCILEYYIYLALIYQKQMQETLMQKERDINKNNLLVLRNQMQPHFIYNSLSIIRSLAKRDSAGAVRCIDSFSEYLKAHIGAIQTDELITFEQELQNVKTYLSLVQADYTRKVSVIYELKETEFRIPPLSLEPIIENAVSHGISKETGIISIRTERQDDRILIVVADNGTGERDPEPIMHNGIGLENTRKRLELHCGGTLEMENSQNGTTVTITVPLQKEMI